MAISADRAKPAAFRHRRYRVLDVLGEGGMGRVYLAEDLLEDRQRVALKVYPAGTSAEHLRPEFLALRELRHASIARAFHLGASESDGAPFFTMEHIAGNPLDQSLAGHPLSAASGATPGAACPRVARGADLLLQAAAACGHLHRRGLLHLDLKPANMLVVDGGGKGPPLGSALPDDAPPLLVLIDFGLIRPAGAHGDTHRGTVPFMAPELFTAGQPDARADVYALGVTFYLALTGRYPFEADSIEGWIRAHGLVPPAPAPELPGALERILMRALAKDPAQRFRDGGALFHAVLGARADLSLGPPPPPVPVEPELVGRDKELSDFERWREEGRKREPILLVSGPDGIGKTRLLSTIETRLEMAQLEVVRIPAGENGRPLLAEAVRRLAHLRPEAIRPRGDSKRGGAGKGEGMGSRLLAYAAGLLPPGDKTRRQADALPDEEARRIARRVAVQRMAGLLRAEPLFLVIDDLDRADAEGKMLVWELAAALTPGAPGGAGVAGAADMGGAAGTAGAAGFPAGGLVVSQAAQPDSDRAGGRAAGVFRIALGPLSRADARRLAQSAAWGINEAVPWNELYRRSSGHPLYLIEELRAWREALGARLPALDAEGRAARRIGALRGLDRDLTCLLAIAGRALPIEVLSLAAGVSRDSASRAARELAFAGLFDRASGGAVRLAHDTLRRAALEAIPGEEAAGHHRRLAGALERCISSLAALLPGGPAAWGADIAHHLFEAGDTKRALALAKQLARDPPPSGFEPPLTMLVLERAGRTLGAASDDGRAILLALGERLDRGGRSEEARRLYQELADRPSLPPAQRAVCLRRLAASCHRTGDTPRAERLLLQALRLVSSPRAAPARGERLAALAELALLYHFQNQTRDAEARAREGLRAFRAWFPGPLFAGQRRAPGWAIQRAIDLHAITGQIAIRSLELEEAARVLSRGLELARAAGADVKAALLLNNLGLALHLLSRFSESLGAFRRADAIARETGDGPALASIRCNTAQIHAKLGRFGRAFAELEELSREPAVNQSTRLRLSWLYSQALVKNLLGDPAADWPAVGALARRIGDGFLAGFSAVYQAEAEMARGSWSAAASHLRSVRAPGARRMAAAREACVEALRGRPAAARSALDRYKNSTDRLPAIVRAWDLLHLGRARMELGEIDRARLDFGEARRFFRARAVRPGAIESALQLAELELRLAASADPKKAARALRAGRSWIEEAQRTPVTTPAGASPRLRSIRLPLLEARCWLREVHLPHRSPADEVARSAARVRDLLAGAGGEAGFEAMPGLAVELAALELALARTTGDRLAENAAARRLESSLARPAGAKTKSSRRSAGPGRSAVVSVFRRLGLEDLSPPSPAAPWPGWARRALVGLLSALAPRAGSRDGGWSTLVERAVGALAEAVQAAAAGIARRAAGGGTELLAAWPPGTDAGTDAALRLRAIIAAASRHGLPPLAAAAASTSGRLFSCPIPASEPVPAEHLALVLDRESKLLDEDVIELLRAAADALGAARGRGAADALGAAGGRGPGESARDRRAPTDTPPAAGREVPTEAIALRTRTVDLPDRLEAAGIIGRSQAMRGLAALISAAASGDIPVLITGESGVGKEVVARAIHRLSTRAHGPFISQNCTAIPAGLLEADLFGYERGAFTGADRTKSGFILRAEGGTFLLDEIGDADLTIQGKIMRMIEEKSVRPVGAGEPIRVDVRFLAVTARDLDELIAQGRFRRDLLYRLAGLRITVPPLRERVEDVGPLLEHFLRTILGREVGIAARALARLQAHPWPGNVRELQTVARRLAIDLEGGESTVRLREAETALAQERPPSPEHVLPARLLLEHPYPEVRKALELEHLRSLWNRHAGDLEGLAAELGTSVRSVYRRFERLGLKPKEFRRKLGKGEPGGKIPV